MQQFLEDTLEGRYIKEFLSDITLPRYNTVTESDYLVEGMTYIYRNDVIRCTSSGFLSDFKTEPYAQFDIVEEYQLGDNVSKLSSNFISSSGYYDADTHKRLGKYLRYLRDIYGIDLMQLYNCYANEYTSKYKLFASDGVKEMTNDTNKVYLVPITFNQIYTIAIDVSSPVIMCPAFIENGSLLKIDDSSITDTLKQYSPSYSKSLLSMSFFRPSTYSINLSDISDDSIRLKMARYEKNLFLLVQVPLSCDSSFVVLEGDYTNTDTRYIFNNAELNDRDEHLSTEDLNSKLRTRPSLIKFNDRHIYAFSDNLIGYLTGMNITDRDTIKNNILRVQKGVGMLSGFEKDVWNDNLRIALFNKSVDRKLRGYDLFGYVDRDTEGYIRNSSYMESDF